MKYIFVTSNLKKYTEVSSMLPNVTRMSAELSEIQSMKIEEVIDNKLDQVKNFAKISDDETYYMVEDTALYLNCLNGFPGPFVKYFNNSLTTSGLVELVEKYNNPIAEAVTMIGLLGSSLQPMYFTGRCLGKIGKRTQNNQFGFEDCFYPDGCDTNFAEMSLEDKCKYSMRGMAVKELIKHME